MNLLSAGFASSIAAKTAKPLSKCCYTCPQHELKFPSDHFFRRYRRERRDVGRVPGQGGDSADGGGSPELHGLEGRGV